MTNDARPGSDIGVAVASIAISLLVIYGTLSLPPGSFDPLGSATVPQVVCGFIIAFSLVIIWQTLNSGTNVPTEEPAAPEEGEAPPPPRHDLALALVGATGLYVLAMAMNWVGFSIATTAFLLTSIGLLSRFERRMLPVTVVLAVVMGFGLRYLFTQVFVIDLP